jgi:hypothetical protein
MGGAATRPWEVKKKGIEETEDRESDQQTMNVLKVQHYN